MSNVKPSEASLAPLFILALGTFAIGTEGFMIAPLLPRIATDLGVRVASAGQLVTAFALAYALSSPILTALTSAVERRLLLVGCMIAFACANVLAWTASNYWELLGARVLLAFASGLYVPAANAVGSALVPPERRGMALAIVNGGLSFAIAIGVPLGAIIGAASGWRTTFAGVAVLAIVAAAGLRIGLPSGFGGGVRVATLQERLRVARHPAVLLGLLVTVLWATGAYTVYTYVATYASTVIGIPASRISMILFLWGVSAASGIYAGGRTSDHLGSARVLRAALASLVIAFLLLSGIARFAPPEARMPLYMATVVLWGASAWAFVAPQQARLIEIAGLPAASIVLSLNASAIYLGFSMGAALGAATLSVKGPGALGVVGALCEVVAFFVLHASSPRGRPISKPRTI